MNVGTGNTSGSSKILPKASFDCVWTALSTLASKSAARRSPAPMSKSSRDFGHVVERGGIGGEAALDSRGSQKSLLPVLFVVWKVSPLRSDMFWNESINEGVMEGLEERAGRRRGLATAEDILGDDRGDVPILFDGLGRAVPYETLAQLIVHLCNVTHGSIQ